MFTSSIRNRDDTCFRCFKQAVAFWFRFPAWVQCAPSVALLRLSRGRFVLLRLLSCGDLKLLREVTGKALLCSAVIEFVAPWCYGFGTVLDFFRWLAPRWASSGLARVGGRSCESGKRSFEEFQRVQIFKRCSSHVQERARAHSRVVLNCPGLDIAHRRLVQSERRYGAEPRPCPGFLGWNLRDPIFHSFRGRYKLTDFIYV